MALTAVQVYKHLPKTNCGDCGVPTCLAFAMQLVQKKASLDACPHVTEEGKSALEGASAPPMRTVTIGTGDNEIKIGGETVMFRHDETFHNQSGIAARVSNELDDAALDERLEKIAELKFVRVGLDIAVDMVAVEDKVGSPDSFKNTVNKVCEKLPHALVLSSENPDSIAAALEVCADRKPLLHAATADNIDKMIELAKEKGCPLAVKADSLEEIADLTQKCADAGLQDLVLDVTREKTGDAIQDLTRARRAALKKAFRPLGYPAMTFTTTDDPFGEPSQASAYVAKYSGIVAMNCVENWQALPVLTVRQNIYTDPRKPIQVEPGIYEVGAPNEDSPLLVTTNFSLTYYTVEGEVEASRVPARIAVIDTEGTSVLTAWAAEKLTPDMVAKMLNGEEVTGKLNHKNVIIPGYIAVMSGKLEDESGWKVVVGPREASGIPKFLKEYGAA